MECCEARDKDGNRTCLFGYDWGGGAKGREKMEVHMACIGSSIVLEGGKSQSKLENQGNARIMQSTRTRSNAWYSSD